MEITVSDFIEKLQGLRDDIKDSPIKIEAPNGLILDPVIKFALKEIGIFDKTKENLKYILITW